jgi:hypothetical protein
LAPDTSGLASFTELEKAKVVGFLAYGQLAMKCPVSRQLKHTLELLLLLLLLLAVTWLELLCGGFMAFWLLYGLNWVLGPCEPVAWDWVLYCMGAWNLDMGCLKLLYL